MRARSPSAGRDWAAAVAGVCAERMRVLSRVVRVNLARTPTISPNLQRGPVVLTDTRMKDWFFSVGSDLVPRDVVFRLLPLAPKGVFNPPLLATWAGAL